MEKKALVTGGGRGIGRAIALALVKDGYVVGVTARSAAEIDETTKLIRDGGGSAVAVVADVADLVSVRAMVREVGPVDLLVNNAGAPGTFGPVWQADPDEWWRCFEVNMRGTFLCCREVVPGMVERRRGRVVNIASGAGTMMIPHMSPYVSSKAAVIRFTEILAAEVKEHGVTAFAVQPGTVRTRMLEDLLTSDVRRRWIPWMPKIIEAGQDVPPELAAELVLYLASGAADALSGRMFSVGEDPTGVVRRAEEVLREELYVLRMRRLAG
jgi:NAD(P)-dependent dehydrogenase (short-subunit alcohol dehydrogenase family)